MIYHSKNISGIETSPRRLGRTKFGQTGPKKALYERVKCVLYTLFAETQAIEIQESILDTPFAWFSPNNNHHHRWCIRFFTLDLAGQEVITVTLSDTTKCRDIHFT